MRNAELCLVVCACAAPTQESRDPAPPRMAEALECARALGKRLLVIAAATRLPLRRYSRSNR